jgi:peptidoglycan/xylan/chitin deacetylase (PgdA/CDA1 family)
VGSTRRLRLLVAIAALAVGAGVLAAVAARPDRSAGPASSTSAPSSTSTSTTAPSTTSSSAPPVSTTTTSPTSTTLPPWSGSATPVWSGPTSRRAVALTFDAGSDVGFAAEILDTLQSNGITASFGVTGAWVSEHPDLVGRMADEGHQLVNHSYDHPSFTGRSTDTGPLPRAERLDQLARTERLIQAVTGTAARPWFRPPYGDEDPSVRADEGSAGYRYEAMWTVDSLGWKGTAASEIVAHCLERAAPGAIYLFHVGAASADHAALQPVIDGLRQEGYAFVTLAQMVAS